jgi:hypothetical protein
MIPTTVSEALETLASELSSHPTLRGPLLAYWSQNGEEPDVLLPTALLDAADALDQGLPALTRTDSALEQLTPMLTDSRAEVLHRQRRAQRRAIDAAVVGSIQGPRSAHRHPGGCP